MADSNYDSETVNCLYGNWTFPTMAYLYHYFIITCGVLIGARNRPKLNCCYLRERIIILRLEQYSTNFQLAS